MAQYSPVIECWEEHGTQRENWSLENATASVVLRCAWNNRHALVEDLLINQRPWPNADLPTVPVAVSAGINPALTDFETDGNNQVIIYKYALVSVNYDVEKRQLVSESLEPTAEFMLQDHRRFRWNAPNGEPLTEGESPGRLVRGMNLVRTIYNVEPPLPLSLLNLAGTVNDATYVSSLLGLSFNAETLLFGTPNLSRTLSINGSDAFTLGLKFTHKASGWNKYWRAKTQSYQHIYLAGGAIYRSHPLASFADYLW